MLLPAATPRRGSLLYRLTDGRKLMVLAMAAALAANAMAMQIFVRTVTGKTVTLEVHLLPENPRRQPRSAFLVPGISLQQGILQVRERGRQLEPAHRALPARLRRHAGRDQGLPRHHARVIVPEGELQANLSMGTFEKWSSAESTVAPCSRAAAAIQMSFVGSGVPFPFNALKMRA